MNKSTLSILMAAMMAVSGFAAAQNPPLPADGTPPPTRADVKAQIGAEGSAGNKRGEGPMINVPAGGSSENSRAGVKAEITGKGTSGVERGEGPMISEQAKTTSAERQAKRDERRAMAKAKREAKMNASASVKPADPMMKDNKAQ